MIHKIKTWIIQLLKEALYIWISLTIEIIIAAIVYALLMSISNTQVLALPISLGVLFPLSFASILVGKKKRWLKIGPHEL